MNVIGKIIGMVAAFVFLLGMGGIDSNPAAAMGMMFVSGMVLVGFIAAAYMEEEEARKREMR